MVSWTNPGGPQPRGCHSRSLNRDMKLCPILLGWIGILLTRSCVSLEVFCGSMGLAGFGAETTAARGVHGPHRIAGKG